MEMKRYDHGAPSWVDLGTPDMAQATKFYAKLFGWDVQVGPPETGGYAIAHLRGLTVAGLVPQQNPGPPYWSTYINVDDADAIAKSISANSGATLMAPFDVLDVGRMGIFADPQGAVFGVWQPGSHKGAQLMMDPGTTCWSELNTTDVTAAIAFYRAVFGWTAKTHDGALPYTEFGIGERSIAGAMPKPPGMPAEVPPHWLVYFAVADTDAAVATAKGAGGQFMAGPMDIEPGRFAVVADPTGAVFGVIALH